MNYSKSTNVLLKLRLICQDRARGRERTAVGVFDQYLYSPIHLSVFSYAMLMCLMDEGRQLLCCDLKEF